MTRDPGGGSGNAGARPERRPRGQDRWGWHDAAPFAFGIGTQALDATASLANNASLGRVGIPSTIRVSGPWLLPPRGRRSRAQSSVGAAPSLRTSSGALGTAPVDRPSSELTRAGPARRRHGQTLLTDRGAAGTPGCPIPQHRPHPPQELPRQRHHGLFLARALALADAPDQPHCPTVVARHGPGALDQHLAEQPGAATGDAAPPVALPRLRLPRHQAGVGRHLPAAVEARGPGPGRPPPPRPCADRHPGSPATTAPPGRSWPRYRACLRLGRAARRSAVAR